MASDRFFQPFWQTQRELVLTPAPTLAAALFKALVIDMQGVWNDGEMSEDCVAIVEADLARFTGETV